MAGGAQVRLFEPVRHEKLTGWHLTAFIKAATLSSKLSAAPRRPGS
jgi:hypothetical protein